MSRSQKLDAQDVMKYLSENEVKLVVEPLGKDGTNLTVMLQVGGARTRLPQEMTIPLMAAAANLMTATGYHARKNRGPLSDD